MESGFWTEVTAPDGTLDATALFDRLFFTHYDGQLYRFDPDEGVDRFGGDGWTPTVQSEEEWDHQRVISPDQARRWLVANGGISDDEAERLIAA